MPRRPATYQDVLDAPEHVTAEIVGGELVLSPRPAEPHAVSASALGAEVHVRYAGRAGDWVILDEPELWLGSPDPQAEVLVPDVAGWRRERYAPPPRGPGFVVPPDWVCEVLSPSSVRHDRLAKAAVYARVGVAWMWIVDPVAETIEVSRRTAHGTWELVGGAAGDVSAVLPPFEGTPFDVGAWWASALRG